MCGFNWGVRIGKELCDINHIFINFATLIDKDGKNHLQIL